MESVAQAPRAGWATRLHAALMPDYNRAAAAYWWFVVVAGAAALLLAIVQSARLPPLTLVQVLAGCGVAMLAGLFPVRIPGSKNSLAGGEVFILLQLLLFGPGPAALAAAGEAFVGSARSSRRWTSRLISPATACLSLMLVGAVFQWVRDTQLPASTLGQGLLLLLAIAAAVAHFMLTSLVLTIVVHLKRGERLDWRGYFDNFAWVGTTFAACAMIAGLLYLAFKASGVAVMAGAVPMMVALLVMLHSHFRHRESLEQAQALRVAAAEREAAQSARHLQELRDSEQRFHSAFAHAAIGMALVDLDGTVLQANPALCALLGCDEQALLRRELTSFFHPADVAPLQRQWHETMRGGAADAVQVRCRAADGAELRFALHSGRFAEQAGSRPTLIVQVQNVTARHEAEARLQHMAFHDGLTSLANRVRFGQCLARAVERCRADRDYCFSVMYLDFDRFKLINDTLGHNAGDRFLVLVAQRLQAQVRAGDTVGRLGGDEFAILIENLADEPTLLAMAGRLQRALSAPYELDGNEITSSASIGITFSTMDYDAPGDVLRDADIAMYRAKAAGRARTAVFDASLRAQLASQVRLERDLPNAIAQGQLSLVYQPIHDLGSGAVDSFEALVRWNHPELGPVSPTVFIPIAEESATIGALTDWVLAQACARLASLPVVAGRRPRLNVNVSGVDMCRAGFVSNVAMTLLRHGLQPDQLTLEITETTLMTRLDAALATMGKLRELGVGLSVDDFGTGYSSLAYLSTLPITSLKIDRSFVHRLVDGAGDAEVVRAVISLGHALGKTVVAEGIETPEQLARLKAMGCRHGQGFLLARPLGAAQVEPALLGTVGAALASTLCTTV